MDRRTAVGTRQRLTFISLGIGWLLSLGVVFVLGILLAFAFHLKPGEYAEAQSLPDRKLAIVIEEILEEPLDWAAVKSVATRDNFPAQIRKAIERLLLSPDRIVRAYQLRQLADGLPQRKLATAIKYLNEEAAGPHRAEALEIFLQKWAELDGRSAVAFALGQNEPQLRDKFLTAVLAGWAVKDANAAWGWVRQQLSPEQQARYLSEIAWVMAMREPEQAFIAMRQLPANEPAQGEVAGMLTDFLLSTMTAPEAIAWLGEFPNGETRLNALQAMLSNWGMHAPEAALEWTFQQPDSISIPAQQWVLDSWVRTEPENAAAWIWQQPEGNWRRIAIERVVDLWIGDQGPAIVAQWLNQQSVHPDLSGAIRSLAMETAWHDSATALRWAQLLEDPEDRIFLETIIGRQWLSREGSAVIPQLKQLLTTNESRQILLNEKPYAFEEIEISTGEPVDIEPGQMVERVVTLPPDEQPDELMPEELDEVEEEEEAAEEIEEMPELE